MSRIKNSFTEAYIVDLLWNDESWSIRHQQKMIAAYAAIYEIHIKTWFIDSRDIKTGQLSDMALRQLAQRICDHKVNTVLLLDINPIKQQLPDTINELIKAIECTSGDIISVATSHIDNQSALLMSKIIAAFDEYERALRGSRRLKARNDIAHRGAFPGGRVPYGYRYIRSSSGLAGWRLEIDEEQAKAVRRTFELRADPKKTLADVASILNAEGHKTAEGKPFTSTQVHRIIQHEGVYRGCDPLPQRARSDTTTYNKQIPVLLYNNQPISGS